MSGQHSTIYVLHPIFCPMHVYSCMLTGNWMYGMFSVLLIAAVARGCIGTQSKPFPSLVPCVALGHRPPPPWPYTGQVGRRWKTNGFKLLTSDGLASSPRCSFAFWTLLLGAGSSGTPWPSTFSLPQLPANRQHHIPDMCVWGTGREQNSGLSGDRLGLGWEALLYGAHSYRQWIPCTLLYAM